MLMISWWGQGLQAAFELEAPRIATEMQQRVLVIMCVCVCFNSRHETETCAESAISFFLKFHVPQIWLGHVSDMEVKTDRCTDNRSVYVFAWRLSILLFSHTHLSKCLIHCVQLILCQSSKQVMSPSENANAWCLKKNTQPNNNLKKKKKKEQDFISVWGKKKSTTFFWQTKIMSREGQLEMWSPVCQMDRSSSQWKRE